MILRWPSDRWKFHCFINSFNKGLFSDEGGEVTIVVMPSTYTVFVEGLDQSRFQIDEAPKDTTMREIALSTLDQYNPEFLQRFPGGGNPRFVVDVFTLEGGWFRARLEQTILDVVARLEPFALGQGGIITVHVGPESIAG